MADEKLTALAALAVPANEDLLYIVDDPAGVPTSKKITRGNFLQPVLISIDTLGPNAADSEFMVGTGAGALAWESGDTLRTSIGVGLADTPTFAGLTISGANGIDIGAAGVDSDLISADGGAEILSWDDSENAFRFDSHISIVDKAISAFGYDNDPNIHPSIRIFRARGTEGAPTAVQANDRLFFFGVNAYGATGFSAQARARIDFFAAANWTDASQATRIQFFTTKDGTTSTLATLKISDDNRVVIGAGIGGISPGAVLHVDNVSPTGAIPVLLLDQADVSEEMMELTSTVGVGNAIEAVGAKTLTTTHFIKVTITGVGTRYFPVGTIA